MNSFRMQKKARSIPVWKMPVSYTHLDVYKRQTVVIPETTPETTPAVEEETDVYKRQRLYQSDGY